MHKKRLLSLFLMMSSLILLPTTVLSAELGSGAIAESPAQIELIQKNDPTNPNNGGPLSITRISHLNFGTQVISGDDKTYFANYRSKDLPYDAEGQVIPGENYPSYIQIDDSRGTNTGWQLYIKNNGFQEKTGKLNSQGESTLKGASLRIEGQSVVTKSPGNVPQSTLKTVTLADDGYHLLVKANRDEGMGITDTLFGETYPISEVPEKNPQVSLRVPGKSAKVNQGNYVSTLTWLLMADPSVSP